MAALADWLALAPKPTPLPAGRKWHVFLSYRSVHRPWVIQLHDILRQLEYDVFLDQYVLAASDNLTLKLDEGLSGSVAGVLVWSKATTDSEWCKAEYASMVAREKSDKNFHFVVAKLDGGELPSLAGNKLYQDFSEYREGPCGSGLLRLLYGLSSQPLVDQSIKFAEAVDQDFRDSLNDIRAAREIGDSDELLRLTTKKTTAWESSALLRCQAADGLISLKRYDDALGVLDAVRQEFPRSLRPKQLQGLALRRKGDWKGALSVLSKLTASGELDPETMGIYAAAWMDKYLTTHNELDLKKSRDLYAQAFINSPRDSYVGINAASKSVMLGDLEAGRKYAGQVEEIVGAQAKAGDYWATATAAEVQLLKGEYALAADLYEAAILAEPASFGSHESTWKQVQTLLNKLQPEAAARERLAGVFKHLQNVGT